MNYRAVEKRRESPMSVSNDRAIKVLMPSVGDHLFNAASLCTRIQTGEDDLLFVGKGGQLS